MITNTIAAAFATLQIVCQNPGDWCFSQNIVELEPGLSELTVTLENEKSERPPEFKVKWLMPNTAINHYWFHGASTCDFPAEWEWGCDRDIAYLTPLYTFLDDENGNRFTTAVDDSRHRTWFRAGIYEEESAIKCEWGCCINYETSKKLRSVKFRFDTRPGFWSDRAHEAALWQSAQPGYEPLDAPAGAFAPLYSSWYCFHQDVFAKEIEEECAIASKMGMKTIIVDDGWQTDDTGRGYDCCGDWEISKRRFPDMKAHVAKVQAMGMKYMVWYSVPFVGVKAKTAERFKGKFLRDPKPGRAGVLDPRFPEVREYLIGIYETAMREWGLDGFKLDFIDSFGGGVEAKPGDGRDLGDLSQAVDALMTGVVKRLKAIKPEVLIEFRQAYVGPAIQKYGNMMRVADCPGNLVRNRSGIAQLRITNAKAAAHSDMLVWHPDETAESAALYVLNTIFGTVQYSMMLRKTPPEHLRMMAHWVKFSIEHERTLQHSSFRAYWPEQQFPLLVAESAAERIVGVYGSSLVAEVAADRPTFVINATKKGKLVVRLAHPAKVTAYDTFGAKTAEGEFAAGIAEIGCPPSGYLEVR